MPEENSSNAETNEPQKPNESEETLLKRALARWQLANEATSENRKLSLDDVQFSIGEQWPSDIKMDRTNSGRPCLTINRIPQNLKLIQNEQRQNRPSIQVNPVGDGADIETAEIEQGMVRHIEINSEAEIAYDHAFDCMLRGGEGYWRVMTDYVSPESDDQEIVIRWIRNQFSVLLDPAACAPDKSDAQWGFIVDDMPIVEYKAQYPKSQLAALDNYDGIGNPPSGWMSDKFIRVAEYYYIEETWGKKDGKRAVKKCKVKWAKINAIEVIEERDILGQRIPIIPVLGEELLVDGKTHLAGMVRYMKDPARAYNFWICAATEMIALAPKAPYIGALGQFNTQGKKWGQANTRNLAFLEYDTVDIHGKPAPPPQRDVYEPPIQAIQSMTRQADQDLKYTSGINSASLGDPEAERSGKAVLLRQKQSDLANLNWSDNLARSIRSTGRLILSWIPEVYDVPRIQRIIKPDETVAHVIVHSGAEHEANAKKMAQANDIPMEKIYDLSVGKYDVTVSVGPSYQSKRQEAVASQLAFIQSFPQAAPVIGDLIVRNMDWPGSKEIADRLKRMLPPQLQDAGDGTPESKLMQAQSQLQQLSQQHEALVQHLQAAMQTIETKQVEAKSKENIEAAKTQAQMSIERMKIEAQITIAQIEAKVQDAQSRSEENREIWSELHGSAHDLALQKDQQSHEQNMAGQQQQAAEQQQQNQQGHEQEMAAQQQEQPAEVGQ